MKYKTIIPQKRKDRNKWRVVYRVPGYSKPFEESFDTVEEANMRAAELNLAKSQGTLRPPSKVHSTHPLTLEEFLDIYITEYGSAHWGDSQYSSVIHCVRDYIKPSALSSVLLRDITVADIDSFYSALLTTPAVLRAGHKTTKLVGFSVIEKIHSILRAAFSQAMKWGYVTSNPVLCASLPKVAHEERPVWSPDDATKAIELCNENPLRICMLLAIGCSMRIGEILGLQWKNVFITEESILNNTSELKIVQELKRCEKASLDAIAKHNSANVFFVFPQQSSHACATCLVLKKPKTKTSIRTVYIPNSVAKELLSLKKEQEEIRAKSGDQYSDYDLVIAWENGCPVEERIIAKALKKHIQKNDLPEVVFHSLRHLSTSLKLQLSGGDIKAVQGDTGHAQPNMVTSVYGHTFDYNRQQLADKMENNFFSPGKNKEAAGEDATYDAIKKLLARNPDLLQILNRISNVS